jgi:hypothetical protein
MAAANVGDVGSVILILTIGTIILQAIYYAIKIWREWNVQRPPRLPMTGEGFELAAGEAFALSPIELAKLDDEMRSADEF